MNCVILFTLFVSRNNMNNSQLNVKPELSVILQRLSYKNITQCPGCSLIFEFSESCARHLLESCLCIKGNQGDRCKLIHWILNFYKSIDEENDNPMDATKINTIVNDQRICPPKKARLEVNLHNIPISICCPVCDSYFCNDESCLDHLFRDCLYLQEPNFSINTQTVKDWLSEFFITNDNNSCFINKMTLKWTTVLCKYCYVNIPNEHLMEHLKFKHTDSTDLEGVVCLICNFSALTEKKLGIHVIKKHMRCVCGFINSTDFYNLKLHVKYCNQNEDRIIQCPICTKSIFLDSENALIEHIGQCKRNNENLQFNDNSLFFECDLCLKQVFVSEADVHLRRHVEQKDHPRARQRRVRVSLNMIKNYLKPHELEQLKL